MKGRVLPAIAIVAVSLLFCLLGPVPRLLFLLLCGIGAVYEAFHVLSGEQGGLYFWLLALYLLICGVLALHGSPRGLGIASLAAGEIILCVGALGYRPDKKPPVVWALATLAYPALPLGSLLFISQLPHWLWPFAAGALTAWICDSAALLVGMRWGRPRPQGYRNHRAGAG